MKLVKRFFGVFLWAISNIKDAAFGIENARYAQRGKKYAESLKPEGDEKSSSIAPAQQNNRLREYFDATSEGKGIYKFLHYFDIYERHFSKFVGQEVHIVEVGVYSGGSMKMWQSYFGDKCHVYGVDILEVCRAHEEEKIKIFIGDQEDRGFWREFKKQVPRVDILIDDGGHMTEQQIVTLEEMVPHLAPGGVYFCEDVSGSRMKLTAYMNGIQNEMNTLESDSPESDIYTATPFQQQVNSIHQYPYAFLIEKRDAPVDEFAAIKKGTVWGPYFKQVD